MTYSQSRTARSCPTLHLRLIHLAARRDISSDDSPASCPRGAIGGHAQSRNVSGSGVIARTWNRLMRGPLCVEVRCPGNTRTGDLGAAGRRSTVHQGRSCPNWGLTARVPLHRRACAQMGMPARGVGRQSPADRGRGMAVLRRRYGWLGCSQPPGGLICDVRVAPGYWIMIDQVSAHRRAPRPGWGRC
jgi:hypothetical protein